MLPCPPSSLKMRAALYREFGGPITVEEVTRPSAPPDGVLIRVKATGVCRSDWHGWKGHDGDIVAHGLPFIPGHEFSGVIVQVGEGTVKFKAGDRVAVPFILSCGSCRECTRCRPTICEHQVQPGFTFDGAFAEFVVIPRADRNLSLLPPNVSFAQAAVLGCRVTTAYRAVMQQGHLKPGETVVVFGCGGLGLSSVMIAASAGDNIRVLAVDTNAYACAKAKDLGAWCTIDANEGDQHIRDKVFEITDNVGADLTIDAAGYASTCQNAVWCTRRGGRMVQVGHLGEQAPALPMSRIVGWEIEIIGSHGAAAVDMPAVLSLVNSGKLQPEKFIEREVSLEEGAKAIQAMDTCSPLGVIVVTDFQALAEPPEKKARHE
eukprot:TRINITY_DN75453_c0_g1_i1.p1 TRINITY_DN75453_c0_g1~~TRINITY_DN75453_c0_g1_i1.p1  ORF type:complete len:376 (-),score=31.49 TRINITY_DN75453_c0_g1_i1:202-1329(-)